jgi:hypothetical protein
MQFADPRDAVGYPTLSEHLTVYVHDAHVVMVLGPIHSHTEHLTSSLVEPEEIRGELMD